MMSIVYILSLFSLLLLVPNVRATDFLNMTAGRYVSIENRRNSDVLVRSQVSINGQYLVNMGQSTGENFTEFVTLGERQHFMYGMQIDNSWYFLRRSRQQLYLVESEPPVIVAFNDTRLFDVGEFEQDRRPFLRHTKTQRYIKINRIDNSVVMTKCSREASAICVKPI